MRQRSQLLPQEPGRAAYGMIWNIPAVNGALALAEQVKVTLHVERFRVP